jgi:hypothetical protein
VRTFFQVPRVILLSRGFNGWAPHPTTPCESTLSAGVCASVAARRRGEFSHDPCEKIQQVPRTGYTRVGTHVRSTAYWNCSSWAAGRDAGAEGGAAAPPLSTNLYASAVPAYDFWRTMASILAAFIFLFVGLLPPSGLRTSKPTNCETVPRLFSNTDSVCCRASLG